MTQHSVLLSLSLCSALIVAGTAAPASADVAMSGTFTASEACPAYQSFRKSTNPGDVKIEQGDAYELISKNKPDATHFRIVVPGAEPEERWVSTSCGRVDGTNAGAAPSLPGGNPAAPPVKAPPSADSGGTRATHVLAMSWQPTFCAQHRDKTECEHLSSESYAASHLSLHGLWPQPRGTQYCNVKPDVSALDERHDWNALPEPEMSPQTLKRLGAVMPGVASNLQRHEWIVHGTCFGTTADSYFARAAGLAEAINASKVAELFASNAGKTLSADSIRAAFDQSFGPGAGARVTISCHGRGDNRRITELVISLAGDVKGSAPIGDLLHAAQAMPPSCPSGLIQQPGS